MKCFLVHNSLPRSRAQPRRKMPPCMVGRIFLPMDIDKSCIVETEAARIVHCSSAPTLAARSGNSLGSDWHTSPLFIPCPEYSKYVLCPTYSLLLFQSPPSFPLSSCSPPASQSLESSQLRTARPKSQEMVWWGPSPPTQREAHFVLTSGLASQPAHVDQAPTECIAASASPSGGLQAQTERLMPHFSLSVSTPKVWPLGLGGENLRSSSFQNDHFARLGSGF